MLPPRSTLPPYELTTNVETRAQAWMRARQAAATSAAVGVPTAFANAAEPALQTAEQQRDGPKALQEKPVTAADFGSDERPAKRQKPGPQYADSSTAVSASTDTPTGPMAAADVLPRVDAPAADGHSSEVSSPLSSPGPTPPLPRCFARLPSLPALSPHSSPCAPPPPPENDGDDEAQVPASFYTEPAGAPTVLGSAERQWLEERVETSIEAVWRYFEAEECRRNAASADDDHSSSSISSTLSPPLPDESPNIGKAVAAGNLADTDEAGSAGRKRDGGSNSEGDDDTDEDNDDNGRRPGQPPTIWEDSQKSAAALHCVAAAGRRKQHN